MFYPGHLMANQVNDWAERHGQCRTSVSFERTLPGMRKSLRRAELALIDATDDPAQASDVFLQAVSVLQAGGVAVYTEKAHEGLEFLVRALGATLLLGPMSAEEWEDYLEHKFPMFLPLSTVDSLPSSTEQEISLSFEEAKKQNTIYYRPIAG